MGNTYNDELADLVVATIRNDIEKGDTTAIYELLRGVKPAFLEAFCPEEEVEALMAKWKR